jgi:regulator of telomere elongation helicase 1
VGFFGSGPQIIYASRTHTQLSQAMAELKRSPYGHLFKACILGAREQFCIHDEVQKTENHSAKVHLCRAKVKAMICPFYNKLHNKDLNDIDERLASVNHDIEDLVQLGELLEGLIKFNLFGGFQYF